VDKFLRSVSRQRLWNKPKIKPNKIGQNQIVDEQPETHIVIKSKPKSHQTGHIVLDPREMPRHRTVHSSLNKDGNKEDDKYNKPIRRKLKSRKAKSGKSWFSTRKTLVILLLCCALMVQSWFIYMVFIKKYVDDPNKENGDTQNVLNIDRGNVNNIPQKIKNEILGGNKVKFQNIKKRLID